MHDQRSLADSARLEHLIVVPRGGLGNGLRAVAAARRLCSLIGAKLTIVWEFGNYDALVDLHPEMADPEMPNPETEVLDRLPANAASIRWIRMPNAARGGNAENRRVPISEDRVLIVESWFWFCAAEEPLVTEKEAMADWLPRPAKGIRDTVREFADAHLDHAVGMHIRRGDNGRQLVLTPIEDFVREAERVVDEGYDIFLATDSEETERMMRERFGKRIIVFPKSWDLPFRWPRLTAEGEKLTPYLLERQLADGSTGPPPGFVDSELLAAGEELVPDFVDLQLLAACDHVIGSEISSYSQMAARYNGSPRCLMLPAPALHPVWGRGLEPPQKMRNYTALMSSATTTPIPRVTAGNQSHGQPRVRRNDYSTLEVPELGQWEPQLTVSVVIPTYDNQAKLDLALAALAAQTYPSHLMQVIVVDDGSEPPVRLPEIAPPDTRIISGAPGGWGAGHAMQAGVQASDGDVIHRLDSDMLIYRDHVEAHMRWHHAADYLVVIGYKRFVEFDPGRHTPEDVYAAVAVGTAEQLFDLERSSPSWIEDVINTTDDLRKADGRAYTVGTGQTISFSRRLYEECEGINTALIRGQDTEFSYRAAQAGAVFIPERQARGYHLGLSEMMTRNAEGMRFREPYLSNRVPLRRVRREETGRQWLVPYVDVVVDVHDASYEDVLGTVEGTLASSTDVRITLVGPWSEIHNRRRAPLDDALLDLRLIREAFMHDGRVRLVESVPPTSAPVPFRLTCPAGWATTPSGLHKLLDIADDQRHGMVLLALPESAPVARLERTAAVARALWLRAEGETLEDVVDDVYGTHWIHSADWALVPAETRPRPVSVAMLQSQMHTLKAEAARWRRECERWEKKATRLSRKLNQPLGRKLLAAARKKISPW